MTSFSPFIALRYRRSPDLDALVAPPYDVISDTQRLALEDSHPANAVRIDYPRDEVQPRPDGLDRYQRVARRLISWTAGGVLAREAEHSLTIYRMTATDAGGNVSITTGVMGALGLEQPGTGDILPHEQTTTKDKADRLSLLRATRVNTSPIWGLSMTPGLNLLYQPEGSPLHRAVDDDGVVHESWVLSDPIRVQAICEAIGRSPIVVADGHHRFETALTYQEERSAAGNSSDAGASALLAFVVELADDQLDVRAIHRIIRTCTEDLVELFGRFCDLQAVDLNLVDVALSNELEARGSMVLLTASGAWFATPRLDSFPAELTLDSERVAHMLATAADHSVAFHHDVDALRTAVFDESAAGAVLLRPATVQQIRKVAETRTRMPAKTTFFWPKPRSGIVFRSLD